MDSWKQNIDELVLIVLSIELGILKKNVFYTYEIDNERCKNASYTTADWRNTETDIPENKNQRNCQNGIFIKPGRSKTFCYSQVQWLTSKDGELTT